MVVWKRKKTLSSFIHVHYFGQSKIYMYLEFAIWKLTFTFTIFIRIYDSPLKKSNIVPLIASLYMERRGLLD